MDSNVCCVETDLLPVILSAKSMSSLNFSVNNFRLGVPVAKLASCLDKYNFSYADGDTPIKEYKDFMGEVRLSSGLHVLVPKRFEEKFYNWSSSQVVVLMPKSELSMGRECWSVDEDIKKAILSSFSKYPDTCGNTSDFCYPISIDDISVFNIGDRKWGYTPCGDFNGRAFFVTELTRDLVLLIDFDSSSCWHRKGYAPEPVKQHLMKFYLDYLSHVRIIPVGSVPDADLPPLGFYPAEREEKAIDAEGRVVESKPDSDSSETTMGW